MTDKFFDIEELKENSFKSDDITVEADDFINEGLMAIQEVKDSLDDNAEINLAEFDWDEESISEQILSENNSEIVSNSNLLKVLIKKMDIDEPIQTFKRKHIATNEQEMLDFVIMMSNFQCGGYKKEETEEDLYNNKRKKELEEIKIREEAERLERERREQDQIRRAMEESKRIFEDQKRQEEERKAEEVRRLEREKQKLELQRLEQEKLEKNRLEQLEKDRLNQEKFEEEEKKRLEMEKSKIEEEKRKILAEKARIEEERKLLEEKKRLAEEKAKLEVEKAELKDLNDSIKEITFDDEDESTTYSLRQLEKKDMMSEDVMI